MNVDTWHSQKKSIADGFSRAALRYDKAARVQQQTGQQLLQYIKQVIDSTSIEVVADIGCGTGYFTQDLVRYCQPQQYLGIDISRGMLDVAAVNNSMLDNITWLCEDVENLQISDQLVSLIYANFSLQWCENLSELMCHFYRVLTPGGYVCFTSLGPNTLYELRDAWCYVDQQKHVNSFYHRDIWQQAITDRQLSIIHHQKHTIVDYFDSVKSALYSIKDVGANTVKGKQRRSLMGKRSFKCFIRAYETFRRPQGIPMTYDIDTWIIQKS
ncbi:malonyl-[acyl-carrier protein] O-methyltransferase BioC [Candidatus Endobugula sertula]|uniref:Malonyl-[acyl-carrier protein] O-methyltransferase n=1 Tax=Candidatus Endobugula sertula TaxID=62101 RepID=A0A1D2QRS6_9GAMM|nr:malonyl-[acyl-carrier protein] O-methyltransferase BioC [Candidatus Endobugula sertula]